MPVAAEHGALTLPTEADFRRVARAEAPDGPGLESRLTTKIYLTDNRTDSLSLYFVDVNTLPNHVDFARAVGIPTQPNGVSFREDMRGTLVYHPDVLTPDGRPGVYTFHFGSFNEYPFAIIERAFDRLATNMPFLRARLAYRPLHERATDIYARERALFDASRIPVYDEARLYPDRDYFGLNAAVGFGRLRVMGPDDLPSPFDVVVYGSLPNDLPRVGGILTAVPQTPLSHVNLRAIQDGVPNAYLRDARTDPRITALAGAFVRLEVRADGFELRAAAREEVDDYFAAIRPDTVTVLPADLSVREVRALDALGFADQPSVGAKAANVAEMRGFGFAPGTIPEGFAVPFHFYDAFLRHNGLDALAAEMLADEGFRQDFETQRRRLASFRASVENAAFPPELRAALGEVQRVFPEGTSLRCRSSTNNEDLPKFSGAGLYTSKTQRPDEGHLEKSVREVYAGLWNYRAFVEREFFRIDHLSAMMAVLIHPNYAEERVNGVAVTTDPRYGTTDTYYLNNQRGEDLVTNPDPNSRPEEILLGAPAGAVVIEVVRRSNLSPDTLLLDSARLGQLRDYLTVIQERFAELYDAGDDESFAMEVEFKVDSSGRLAIKQARPWVGYRVREPVGVGEVARAAGVVVYPSPSVGPLRLRVTAARATSAEVEFYDPSGRLLVRETVELNAGGNDVALRGLPPEEGLVLYSVVGDGVGGSGVLVRARR